MPQPHISVEISQSPFLTSCEYFCRLDVSSPIEKPLPALPVSETITVLLDLLDKFEMDVAEQVARVRENISEVRELVLAAKRRTTRDSY